MKKSGTYTDTMTISQVFASMADNTSITFAADNGSAIGNELGLDQSYQGVSVLVVRSTTWRGFAVASMGTAPIWIAGSSGANQLQWKQYAQKDDLADIYRTDTNVTVNLNSLESGFCYCNADCQNLPESAHGFCLTYYRDTNTRMQMYVSLTNKMYYRIRSTGIWNPWIEK